VNREIRFDPYGCLDNVAVDCDRNRAVTRHRANVRVQERRFVERLDRLHGD